MANAPLAKYKLVRGHAEARAPAQLARLEGGVAARIAIWGSSGARGNPSGARSRVAAPARTARIRPRAPLRQPHPPPRHPP